MKAIIFFLICPKLLFNWTTYSSQALIQISFKHTGCYENMAWLLIILIIYSINSLQCVLSNLAGFFFWSALAITFRSQIIFLSFESASKTPMNYLSFRTQEISSELCMTVHWFSAKWNNLFINKRQLLFNYMTNLTWTYCVF